MAASAASAAAYLAMLDGLPRGLAVVVLPRGLPGHQRRELGLDLRLGQRVRHALVGADRLGPYLPLAGVPGRGGQRVPGDPHAEGGAGDPFRVQPVEHLPEALARLPTSAPGPTRTPSKCRVNCRSGSSRSTGSRRVSRPAASVGTMNSDSCAAALVLPGPGDDQQRLGLVHPGDVVLGAGQHPVLAVPGGGGRDPQGVGAGVRFGDREHHLGRAVGQAGQPPLALLLGAELGDHPGRDRRRDEQQQQRGARRRRFPRRRARARSARRRHRRRPRGCSRR